MSSPFAGRRREGCSTLFIFTAKFSRRKLIGFVIALLILCVGVWGLWQTLFAPEGSTDTMAATSGTVRSNEDRIAYLKGLGWQVSAQPLTTEEVLIPEEFDESYTDYLALQSQQGFDLSEYQGKRVKRYTYEITNYPTGETGVQISLLVYRDTVIGGEVFTTSLDGFMHGLTMPS